MSGLKVKIQNVSSTKHLKVALTHPDDLAIPPQDRFIDLAPNQQRELPTSSPTINLYLVSTDVVLWRGIVPSNASLKFSPEMGTLKEGENTIPATLLPAHIRENMNENIGVRCSIFRNRWLWAIILILLILVVLAYFNRKKVRAYY